MPKDERMRWNRRIEHMLRVRISRAQSTRIQALKPQEVAVLFAIGEMSRNHEPAIQKRLARVTGFSQSWMSRVVTRLLQNGFLEAKKGEPIFYVLSKLGQQTLLVVAGPEQSVETFLKDVLVRTHMRTSGGQHGEGAKHTSTHMPTHNQSPYPLRVHNVQVMVPVHRRPGDEELARAGWQWDETLGWKRWFGRSMPVEAGRAI